MGGRDIRHRETKKPKKTEKKSSLPPSLPPLQTPPEVQVVGKRKRKPAEEEV